LCCHCQPEMHKECEFHTAAIFHSGDLSFPYWSIGKERR
jgi:hypothetical protein